MLSNWQLLWKTRELNKKLTNITVAVQLLLKYSSEHYLLYSNIFGNTSESKPTLKCFDY